MIPVLGGAVMQGVGVKGREGVYGTTGREEGKGGGGRVPC